MTEHKTRNLKIIKLHDKHHLSFDKIAKLVGGITRQRAWNIYKTTKEKLYTFPKNGS